MCSESVLDRPAELHSLIEKQRVECAEFLPTRLRTLVAHMHVNKLIFTTFKILICGSDNWYISEYFDIKNLLPSGTRLINSYGTSETAIDSSYFEFTDANLYLAEETVNVPIGKAFPGMSLELCDEDIIPVTADIPGELYIGGLGVSLGYINAPELNAQKFVTIQQRQGIYFRTGDFARRLSSRDMEFLGRKDAQVKFRGKRIDLSEIEAALLALPFVQNGAVMLTEKEGIQHLTAFYVGTEVVISISSLRATLSTRLPEHMLPDEYVSMSVLPTNLNGKIDRVALISKLAQDS
jgi:non-ribosomal peptide synthetase component F